MIQTSTLGFLKKLKKNNDKSWFDAHRDDYEAAKKDMEAFTQAVLDRFGAKEPDIRDLTAKNCLFRINRDVRFSKNKAPYKTNLAASMGRGGKKSIFAGYYIHIEPGSSFVGGGIWMPMAPELKKIRQEIDYCFEEFDQLITGKKFKSVYKGLDREEGFSLSKVPQGFDKDNPAAEYLKLKSWIASRELSEAEVSSPKFLKQTVDAFEALQPLVQFINMSLE
ncbi:MAG: DUF2461 domain-containing protein [Candidatus Pseudobacter hemicellulosilyticus]|uniref:DUF2461 domain-containing protein n=1 Tax=Candidatus Pseudobacter hemicellulosilyticus TaxID=3121375 RepID=A0AAJ5WS17_9BACT|nr:MAG: DUF2461 domain-containing protein [Pseudobacter sp.]